MGNDKRKVEGQSGPGSEHPRGQMRSQGLASRGAHTPAHVPCAHVPPRGRGQGRPSLGPAFPRGARILIRLRPAQSLMLAKAKECWEQEHEEREAEKKRYLAERIPALQTRGLSLSALQVGGGVREEEGPDR